MEGGNKIKMKEYYYTYPQCPYVKYHFQVPVCSGKIWYPLTAEVGRFIPVFLKSSADLFLVIVVFLL